jgi:hypothetical protein
MRKLGIKEAEQNKEREPSIVHQQPTSTHVFRYIFLLELRNKKDFLKRGAAACWNKCLIG